MKFENEKPNEKHEPVLKPKPNPLLQYPGHHEPQNPEEKQGL